MFNNNEGIKKLISDWKAGKPLATTPEQDAIADHIIRQAEAQKVKDALDPPSKEELLRRDKEQRDAAVAFIMGEGLED